MSEVLYEDQEIRHFSKDYTKIPMTFLNTGDMVAGVVIGETADGYGNKVRRTTLTSNASAAATELVVADVSIFKGGDIVSIMKVDGSSVEELGAITAIAPVDKKITVTTAVTAAHTSGSYAYVRDGSQKAVGILADTIIDEGDAVVANVYIGGAFDSALIKGLDSIAKADLGARIVAGILIVPGC